MAHRHALLHFRHGVEEFSSMRLRGFQPTVLFRLLAVGLVASSVAGCVAQTAHAVFSPMLEAASQASLQATMTPESMGISPSTWRGQSCANLEFSRNYMEKEKQKNLAIGDSVMATASGWQIDAINQVRTEQNCVAGAGEKPSADVQAEPERSLSAQKNNAVSPPPVSVSPPTPSTQAVGSRWGSTTPEGLPQTSLDQWIAKETAENYQGRSCEYLQRALAQSEEMEASSEIEIRTWGASKNRAISGVLAGRSCPAASPGIGGRLGAGIAPMDTIKAARLGMPLAGASIEKIVPGGPAEQAGLKFADVVVAFGATPISDDIDLRVALNKTPPGTSALLQIWRRGVYLNVPVILGSPL